MRRNVRVVKSFFLLSTKKNKTVEGGLSTLREWKRRRESNVRARVDEGIYIYIYMARATISHMITIRDAKESFTITVALRLAVSQHSI